MCCWWSTAWVTTSSAAAPSRWRQRRAAIDAPSPTTTVSLSCLVTAATPSAHGVIGHLIWLPEMGSVVNTLRWVTIEDDRWISTPQRCCPPQTSGSGCAMPAGSR